MKYQVHPGRIVELHLHQWLVVRLIDLIEDLINSDPGTNHWYDNFLAGIWLHYTLRKDV